jgi:ubiquinone/menaquinone biosynthesis C-methylase UbiE
MAKLGLPFEYQIAPEYFDAYNLSANTDENNSIIEGILKNYKVKTVLDLTCGTGSQVFHLAKLGYSVIGADLSSSLIKIARKKAAQENMNVKFLDGDMRCIQVGEFDAVITIFNAIGHLTKPGFEKALRNINRNLRPNGIYVFDIVNLEAMSAETVANLAWHNQKTVGNMHIHGVQCSIIDRKLGRLTAFDYVVLQKNAKKPELRKYKFSLQIYRANELKKMLDRQGFEVIEQRGLPDPIFVKDKTLNILTVARKLS